MWISLIKFNQKSNGTIVDKMEFFLPGLLIFLVSILFTSYVAPKITPIIAAILSIIFLAYGVYDHYTMFADEYRLSTWHEGLRIYAPAIMILAIILFVIYGIMAFFTSGSVPVPSMPAIELPSPDTATNSMMNSLNNAMNSISNVANNMSSLGAPRKNNGTGSSLIGNVTSSLAKMKNNLPKSFVETV